MTNKIFEFTIFKIALNTFGQCREFLPLDFRDWVCSWNSEMGQINFYLFLLCKIGLIYCWTREKLEGSVNYNALVLCGSQFEILQNMVDLLAIFCVLGPE